MNDMYGLVQYLWGVKYTCRKSKIDPNFYGIVSGCDRDMEVYILSTMRKEISHIVNQIFK